jgi:hypothetical protein
MKSASGRYVTYHHQGLFVVIRKRYNHPEWRIVSEGCSRQEEAQEHVELLGLRLIKEVRGDIIMPPVME